MNLFEISCHGSRTLYNIDDIKDESKRVQIDNNYKIITFSKTGEPLYGNFVYLYHNSLFREPSIRTELISLTSSTTKEDRNVLLNKIIINGVLGHLKNDSQEYIQFIDDVKLYNDPSIYNKTILQLFREALVDKKLLNKKSDGLIYKLFTMCREYHIGHIKIYNKHESSSNKNNTELNKLKCIVNQNTYEMGQLKSDIESLRKVHNKKSKDRIKELETIWSQLNQTNNNHNRQISILEETIKKLTHKIEKELTILNFNGINPNLEDVDIYKFLNSYDDNKLENLLNECLKELEKELEEKTIPKVTFFVEPVVPSMKYIDFFKSIRYYNCFINVYDCKHSIPNFDLSFNPEYSPRDGFKSGVIDYTDIKLTDLIFEDESRGKQRDPYHLKKLFKLNKLDYLNDKVGEITKPDDFKDIRLTMKKLIEEIKKSIRDFKFNDNSTFVLTACNGILKGTIITEKRPLKFGEIIEEQIFKFNRITEKQSLALARQYSLETNTMVDLQRKYINSEEIFRKKYLIYKNKYLQLKNKLQ